MDNNHVVIDGNFLLHTAIPYDNKDRSGPHIASYNFIRSVSKWAESLRAGHVTVCWDAGVPALRRQMVPDYKKNRIANKGKERYEEFGRNKEFLTSVLPNFGIRTMEKEGFEADDLIYGIATLNCAGTTSIVSGDLDLSQLVGSYVYLYRPDKPRIDLGTFHNIVLDKNYDIRPRGPGDVLLYKAVRGDTSDNIKPVIKPKIFSVVWSAMHQRQIPPTLSNFRTLLTELTDLKPDETIERNYNAVNLAHSGIAGDAIEAAMISWSSPVTFSESEIVGKFEAIGIQPTFLHSLFTPFQTIR